MPLAYLSLGSNQGDRRGYLEAAVRRLRAAPGVRVAGMSPVYETVPHGEGYAGLPPFLNAAVALDVDLAPQSLLRLCLEIEHQFGRARPTPKSARTLDLDLLLYGEQVWDDAELTLPHPRMAVRAFVLVPLADLAPDVVHPLLRRSARDLLHDLTDTDRAAVTLPKPPAGVPGDAFRGVRGAGDGQHVRHRPGHRRGVRRRRGRRARPRPPGRRGRDGGRPVAVVRRRLPGGGGRPD